MGVYVLPNDRSVYRIDGKKVIVGIISSKPEAHGHLKRSWAAGLKDWGQAAARTFGAEHQIQHGAGLAKQRAGQKANWIGEIGVIQRIKGLNAELKGSFLA